VGTLARPEHGYDLHCAVPWSIIPTERVVRLGGMTADQLAISLDPLPDDAPVVIAYGVTPPCAAATAIVNSVLVQLEVLGRELFPAWLPGADAIDGASGLDLRTARELARRLGSTSNHYGPFLADLAEAALLHRPLDHRFTPEIRARGLSRLLRDCYRRDSVALAISTSSALGHDDQRTVAAAAEWLANHGRIGVWLVGELLPQIDRFPLVTLPLPTYLAELARAAGMSEQPTATVGFPVLTGRPHPGSRAEQALESALARCDWARGRSLNQTYQTHRLAPPIRVDLMWPDARCAVEIDGPDHRGVLKYADDRRRDNTLVLGGFAVLRFTNDEVAYDLPRVLDTIRTLLTIRRHDERTQA
jgi:very-short-patch-repair endonuclease